MLNRGHKVIAVIATTRDEVEAGIAHARTAPGSLPIWAWCAERSGVVPDCQRFHSPATAMSVWKDLRKVWPALSIVSWTGAKKTGGKKYIALKLIPLFIPPFRVVAFNEVRGFFPVRPGPVLNHATRRMRDAAIAAGRRLADWFHGGLQWLHSVAYRTGQRLSDLANWFWNVFLAALAFLARPTGPVARSAMRRAAPGRSVEEPAPRLHDDSFVEIPLSNRAWRRSRTLGTIENSNAAFVVFRAQRELAPAEPLVALARETNSFAAARQTAWSGWRKVVLNRHPFRVLQPGEVTELAAPHSTLIAMRRDLILRFGLPHALTAGAALMQLFWKAAAAGIPSLTVGCDSAVTQEPAMELEDAEFVVRRDRSLAPLHPENSRGNVAWSPLHRKPFRGKPRVLVVSPYLPFPLSHGGAVRIYNLCRALSEEFDFVLACFREKDDTVHYEELHRIFREVYVVDIDEKHADPGVPTQIAGYRNSAMAALLKHPVDLVQLEYTQMAEYRNYPGAAPVVLVEHDITFTLHGQLATRDYQLWLDFENKALRACGAVWTMSEHDRELAVKHGAPCKSTAVIANGVDLLRFQPLAKTSREQTILFVGSFRHLPNLLAFKALRETIMPRVWESCPAAKLHVIAGPKPPRFSDLDSRIVVEAFVEDVRPAYRDCDVAVVPLSVSAGTNIKVMEAMACGRAIVSTPIGCQGLDLRDSETLLVRDIGPDFAAAITLLLNDADLRARLGESARITAEARFGWDAIAREARRSYSALLDMMWDSDENSTARDVPVRRPAVRAGAPE